MNYKSLKEYKLEKINNLTQQLDSTIHNNMVELLHNVIFGGEITFNVSNRPLIGEDKVIKVYINNYDQIKVVIKIKNEYDEIFFSKFYYEDKIEILSYSLDELKNRAKNDMSEE